MLKNTFSVGIPTCNGASSLMKTIKFLRTSRKVSDFPLYICADRVPFSQWEIGLLEHEGVSLIWNELEGSQFKKLKQIIEQVDTEIFIFTQDDIIFQPNTVEAIVKAFDEDSTLTMVSVKISPLPSKNLVENSLGFMVKTIAGISGDWNNGDNYLAASGRCMAFRTSFLKKFTIPDKVINGDMYLYLENKYYEGKFAYLSHAEVFIKCPDSFSEQLKPSSRFQYSFDEMKRYFSDDIQNEYVIPLSILLKAAFIEAVKNPVSAIVYTYVFFYTRFRKYKKDILSITQWKVEMSTKL